jgi:AcrR family transcriptional regulator
MAEQAQTLPGATPVREADGRRLRWTEHRAQRREAFVIAGITAVDTHGPSASAEQIAESAGVSRTVLYRYFRDRDDLRQAIADHVVAEVVASVLPHLAITPDSTPREVISSTVNVIVAWFDEHPNLYMFLRDRRNGHSLETVESTLADQVAALLKILMLFFGIDDEQAEPGAYGIVGFVESAGAWWLARRTISRETFAEGVCNAIWHLLEGTARANGVIIEYDEPLPFAAITEGSS